MPMNQELKAEWVRRLREPGRKQGCGQLRTPEGDQCCLDVAMEMAVEAGITEPPVLNNSGTAYVYHFTIIDEDGFSEVREDDGVLTDPVRVWMGLEYADPYVHLHDTDPLPGEDDSIVTLSHVNDVILMNFGEIADAIEADENI
jgi:hypothetical protein